MTHEDPQRSYPEHRDGPEHDHSLPDAIDVPETTDVEASLAPAVRVEISGTVAVGVVGAEPGWWQRPDIATQIPRWSGPTENEA